MIISILKDFKVFDVGSKSTVIEISSKIKVRTNQITLDLTKCIIDYPATSILIDKILFDMESEKPPRVLIIRSHLNILELLLLHWLFIGSKYFEIQKDSQKNNIVEFRKVINERLIKSRIQMQIQIIHKNEEILKKYQYGI